MLAWRSHWKVEQTFPLCYEWIGARIPGLLYTQELRAPVVGGEFDVNQLVFVAPRYNLFRGSQVAGGVAMQGGKSDYQVDFS